MNTIIIIILAHMASSRLITAHQASSGLVWPHIASPELIWLHSSSSGPTTAHLASSSLIVSIVDGDNNGHKTFGEMRVNNGGDGNNGHTE